VSRAVLPTSVHIFQQRQREKNLLVKIHHHKDTQPCKNSLSELQLHQY
jgi:hypothetical protein